MSDAPISNVPPISIIPPILGWHGGFRFANSSVIVSPTRPADRSLSGYSETSCLTCLSYLAGPSNLIPAFPLDGSVCMPSMCCWSNLARTVVSMILYSDFVKPGLTFLRNHGRANMIPPTAKSAATTPHHTTPLSSDISFFLGLV